MSNIKKFLLDGTPVIILTGNEFAKIEGITLKEQITAFFDSIGNTAKSVFGNILLDNKAFKSDSAHGLSREKIASFQAIPQILENGISILPMKEHKKGVLSGMIAAPICIAEKEYIAVAVIRGDKNRLYVHEVTLKEKLLDNNNQEVVDESSFGSSNPVRFDSQATNQGDIAKVLQNILTSK